MNQSKNKTFCQTQFELTNEIFNDQTQFYIQSDLQQDQISSKSASNNLPITRYVQTQKQDQKRFSLVYYADERQKQQRKQLIENLKYVKKPLNKFTSRNSEDMKQRMRKSFNYTQKISYQNSINIDLIDQYPQDFTRVQKNQIWFTSQIQKLKKQPNYDRQVRKIEENIIKQKEINQKIFAKKQVICYNCGGNHYSDKCKANPDINYITASGKVPKCFNCKKIGHSSKFCIQPRKCNYCGGIGHFSRDCSSNPQILNNGICLNCKMTGHFAKQCKQPKKCMICLDPNHLKQNCPNKKRNLECFYCHQTGHYKKQCPNIKCYKCKGNGHFISQCPNQILSKSLDQNKKLKKSINKRQKQFSNEKGKKSKSLQLNSKILKFQFKKKPKKFKIKQTNQLEKDI